MKPQAFRLLGWVMLLGGGLHAVVCFFDEAARANYGFQVCILTGVGAILLALAYIGKKLDKSGEE